MADIWINILGDATKLKGALDKADKNVTSFSDKVVKVGKIATAAGVAVTAAFTAIVLKTAAVGDQFDKMSLRTGIAVEDLSSLAYAADISGTDIGTLEKGLKALTKVMDDASIGIGEGYDAFLELDIAVTDIDGSLRSTTDVLKEAATKISEIEDPTKQAALAMDLFGARAGPALLPLLKMGGAGIEELMAKAEELGITMTTEAATAAADFTDAMTDLKGSLAGAGRMIGDTLIPIITPLIEKVTEIVIRVKEWAEENAPLVENIFKWAAGLGVALAVLGPILVILPSLIAGITMLSGAFLPFAIGATIVLGIKKLSEYMGDVKERYFELYTTYKEWSLDELDAGIADLNKTIAGLEAELEEAEKGFSFLGIELKNQDVNVGRLKQVIKDYKIEVELLEEQQRKLTGTVEEDIVVTKTKKTLDEEAAKVLETLAEAEAKAEAELKALTAEKELANAQAEIENKLFALGHTAMEVAERDLDLLAEEYIKKGLAQEIVDEWHGKEIARLKELNEKQEEHISTMEEVARVTKAVEDAWFELTHEPYEVVIKKINERYDEHIKVIKDSTLSIAEQEKEIRKINKTRDKEIEGVDKLTDEEKELAKAYDKVKDEILELTETPMETMIRKLEEEAERMRLLGVEIEDVNEWLRLQKLALTDTGDAFTKFGEIAWDALKKVTDYIVDNLTPAIENFFFGIEDYEFEWDTFWEGLWNVLKTYISNMIAKLLIAIPLMLIWSVITGGGLTWANFWLLWGKLSFEKGGGVGYDKGGQVKEYQAGGGTDTVSAMLTPGEYVIARPMVDIIKRFKMIPSNLIDAIAGGFPTPVPAFATGGPVGNPNITSTGYGDTNINVYITGNKISDDVDIRNLATKVSDEILRKLNLKRRH